MDYREVKRGTVEIAYWIVEYDREDGTKCYDWRMSNGDDSDELWDTIEEAEADAIGNL